MKDQKKTGDKKPVAAASAPAENKSAVKDTSAAEVKTETKTASAAKKTTASKAKPAAAKAKTAAKKPAAKTAAKSTAKKVTAAKKTTAGAAVKTAKTAAKKTAPAKKTAKKSDAVTVGTICTKLEKKLGKKTSVKEKVAVDIEVWGFEDGSNGKMYIEINGGKITVSPHTYEEKDFRVSLSCANAVAFVDGKLTLKALIESKDFYAEGNIAAAVKLAAIF